MANHYSTTIKIIGHEADVTEVMGYIEETNFDFNKIIPLPKELLDLDSKNDNESISKVLDWRYANWGTRNDALDVEVEGNGLYYETLNGAAIPILEHISSSYPNVKIEFSFIDRQNLEGYDGAIQAGEVIWSEYHDYYPHDDDDVPYQSPSSPQALTDDDLPF